METDPRLLDKEWRMKYLYRIKTKDEGKTVKFRRNKAQQHFEENRTNRNIILKSRQLGFTTLETIDTLDDVLFKRNFDALIIAHVKEEALKIFDSKIDFAWKNFNEGLKTLWKVDTERANTLKFGFGDGSYSSLSVAVSGRSGTYQRVHISEFGKLCKENPLAAKEIISGTIPSVPLSGRLDIESTAEGEIGYFHDMFWDAWNRGEPTRPTEFKAHFYNWVWDEGEISKISAPEKDLPKEFKEIQNKFGYTDIQITYYFYKWLSLGKDWNLLRQEYPNTPEEAFITSGNKLFSLESIEEQSRFVVTGEKKGDWVYLYQPVLGHKYAIGADIAEGVGNDSSAAVVWDFTTPRPRVVATYKNNKISPDLFAFELKEAGELYNNALLAPERNNHGHATIVKLREIYNDDLIYKKVIRDTKDDVETKKLGWETNLVSKPKMFYDLNTALTQALIEIPSQDLLFEMRTYDRDNLNQNKASEEQTKHWDLLTAAAIGFQMRTHELTQQITYNLDEEENDNNFDKYSII